MTTKTSTRNKTAAAKGATKRPDKAAAKQPDKAAAKSSTKQPDKAAAKRPNKAAAKSPTKRPAEAAAADGRADFEALAAEYKKLPAAQVVPPRLDVQTAITHVLGLAQHLDNPALRKRFLSLPETELPPALLQRLPQAARAARYAFLGLSTTAASTPAIKVSLELLQEATALRTRMLAVCEYLLGDQAEHAAELRDIRQGRGYQDLADDLARLAALYDREAAVVQQDPKHYRADDHKQARTLAARILAEVAASASTAAAEAQGGKVPAARDAAYRAFALLARYYDEVAAAGRYLLRHENGAEIFGSLYSVGRRAAKHTRPKSPEPSPATP
ncbi:MAG TPA: hypothetical protein PLW65_15970 [Pseudomonadota bacterium]|nr:hypothetical protein [Pseudomonadota bacterium]